MSIAKIISWISAHRPAKLGESISYEAIFKGSPARQEEADGNFMPGLRSIENDVDTYFKDVFAGPVF